MSNDQLSYWFEKIMAVVFLFIIVGMIMFFNFVPMQPKSENVILIILGVFLGVAKDIIPKIFGVADDEQERLNSRIQDLERQVEDLMIQNQTLKYEYDKILKVLVNNFVIDEKEGDDSE